MKNAATVKRDMKEKMVRDGDVSIFSFGPNKIVICIEGRSLRMNRKQAVRFINYL